MVFLRKRAVKLEKMDCQRTLKLQKMITNLSQKTSKKSSKTQVMILRTAQNLSQNYLIILLAC